MSTERRRVTLLAGLLGGSGVLHFLAPKPYEKIVPPSLGNPATLVRLSGVAELACAGMLVAPHTRRAGGLLSAGLFAGVFPANVYAIKVVGSNPLAKAAAIARLPLQVPMISMALKVARGTR